MFVADGEGVCVGWVAICCFDTTETFSAKPITAFDTLYAPVFVGAFGFGRISDSSFKLYSGQSHLAEPNTMVSEGGRLTDWLFLIQKSEICKQTKAQGQSS